MSRTRLNIFIEQAHAKRLQELATLKGISKSAVVASALAGLFAFDGAEPRETVLTHRLDRLTHQFGRLERDQTILIEMMASFIRYYFSATTPVPPSQQEAARAQGKARFEEFTQQLGRQLQRGVSALKSVQPPMPPDTAATASKEPA